ncbi:hypothetical protein [Paenibacillus terrae]|uniref:hypothetical protein n=1 Tax=Paenibacillus terrae TaxID=159743 RepID=UPI001269A2C3|nr:hypothetical protein [Paenibacillus terrae]
MSLEGVQFISCIHRKGPGHSKLQAVLKTSEQQLVTVLRIISYCLEGYRRQRTGANLKLT